MTEATTSSANPTNSTATASTGDTTPTAPRRAPLWTALAGLLLLLLLAVLTAADLAPPSPAPESAPATEFSAERAHGHIEEIARAPHPMGSEEHARVRDHLVAELRATGLEPEVHEAVGDYPDRIGGPAQVGRVQNIVAVIEGTAPTGQILLAAHYDSVPSGPGANDDGVGVATVLEVARALQASGEPPRNDVVLLLTDGEEEGLLGAKAFVDDHPLAEQGGIVLNHEARGAGGTVYLFRATEGSADLIRMFGSVAPYPAADSTTSGLFELLPNDTDYTAFELGGFRAMDFAYAGESVHYHSVLDTPENVDRRTLQQMGANTLAFATALGARDLVALDSEDDLVFFNAPPGLLVRFDAGWMPPLALAALGLTVAAAVLARRRSLASPLRVLAGAGLTVLLIAAGVGAGMLYWWGLVSAREEFGRLVTGTPYRPEWFQAALLLVVVALGGTWYALLRRRVGAHALALGALLTLALAGTAAAFAAPAASAPLVLPALGAALGGLLAHLAAGPGSPWRPVLLTVGLAPAAVLLLAAAWINFDVGLDLSAYLSVPLALLGLVLLLPLVDAVWPGRRAVLVPLTAVVAAGAVTAAGLAANPVDETRPTPTMLTYTLDADSGDAYWSSREAPNHWTAGYVGEEADGPVPGPWWRDVHVGPAEAAPLDAPGLDVREDVTEEGMRTLSLDVASVRGADHLGLFVEEGADRVVEIVVEGRTVTPVADESGTLGFWFHALADDGVVEVEIVAESDTEPDAESDAAPLGVRITDYDALPSALEGIPGYEPPPGDLYLYLGRVSVTRAYEI